MDSGLLMGLTEGLKSGLTSYKDERDREYKRTLEQKKVAKEDAESADRLALLKDQRENEKLKLGLKKDDQGNWVQDPESQFIMEKKQKGLLQEAQTKAAEVQARAAEAGILKTKAETGKIQREARGLLGSDEQSFKTLPKDKQIMIEKLSGSKAGMAVAKSQIEELRKQVQDTTIPANERLASANEQLKLLNSTLGADAVGAEEVSRLASFLQYAPDPFGPKGLSYGPDLDSFGKQLERIEKRIAGSDATFQKQIDTAYGRKPGLIQQAAPAQQPAQEAQDPQIAQYAKQYKLDYGKAKAIIDKRRGQ